MTDRDFKKIQNCMNSQKAKRAENRIELMRDDYLSAAVHEASETERFLLQKILEVNKSGEIPFENKKPLEVFLKQELKAKIREKGEVNSSFDEKEAKNSQHKFWELAGDFLWHTLEIGATAFITYKICNKDS